MPAARLLGAALVADRQQRRRPGTLWGVFVMLLSRREPSGPSFAAHVRWSWWVRMAGEGGLRGAAMELRAASASLHCWRGRLVVGWADLILPLSDGGLQA